MIFKNSNKAPLLKAYSALWVTPAMLMFLSMEIKGAIPSMEEEIIRSLARLNSKREKNII